MKITNSWGTALSTLKKKSASKLTLAGVWSMWFAFLLNAMAALYAACLLRPLFTEGVHWLFVIFNSGRPFVDWQYQRYADILPQLPTVVMMRWFPSLASTPLPTLAFSFSYAFQPILLLFIALLVLILEKRNELIPICLLSFALATQPVAPAAQMIVQQTLGLFWVTFFLLLFFRGSWREMFLLMLSMLALALTHEVSILCFVVLAAISIRQIVNFGIKSRYGIVLIFNSLLSVWIAYRVLGPHPGHNNLFIFALTRPWDAFRWYTITSTVLVMTGILLWIRTLRKPSIYIIGFVLLIMTMGFLLIDGKNFFILNGEISLWNANFARTTSVPVALVLAVVVMGLEFFGRAGALATSPMRRFLYFCATLALLSAATHDFRLSQNWGLGVNSLEKFVAESPSGCHLLKDSPDLRYWASHDFAMDRLSLFSVVLQFNKNPTKILFAADLTGTDSCETLRSSGLIKNGWTPFELSPSSVKTIFESATQR